MAHEGVGMGAWSGGVQTIPVTQPREFLAILDITDPTHPKLVRTVTDNAAGTEFISTEVIEDIVLDDESKTVLKDERTGMKERQRDL